MRRIARDHFRHAVECDDGQIVPDHVRRLRVAQWPSQFVKNALLGGYSYQTDRLWADLVKRQMCIRRSEWRGHVTVPKGGRLRYVPMTARLASAVHDHRHLESPRVLCLEDGSPLTQDIVGEHVRKGRTTGGFQRAERIGCVIRSVHSWQCGVRRHGQFRSWRDIQDLTTTQQYMHLSPAAVENAIRLLEQPGPAKDGHYVRRTLTG
jgi:hypothetical protein